MYARSMHSCLTPDVSGVFLWCFLFLALASFRPATAFFLALFVPWMCLFVRRSDVNACIALTSRGTGVLDSVRQA
jgi:hypothetical protein